MTRLAELLSLHWFAVLLLAVALALAVAAVARRGRGLGLLAAALALLGLGDFLPADWAFWLAVAAAALLFGELVFLILSSHWSAVLGYATGAALLLGLGFLACAVGFWRAGTTANARRVLRASLVYLPALLVLLLASVVGGR